MKKLLTARKKTFRKELVKWNRQSTMSNSTRNYRIVLTSLIKFKVLSAFTALSTLSWWLLIPRQWRSSITTLRLMCAVYLTSMMLQGEKKLLTKWRLKLQINNKHSKTKPTRNGRKNKKEFWLKLWQDRIPRSLLREAKMPSLHPRENLIPNKLRDQH